MAKNPTDNKHASRMLSAVGGKQNQPLKASRGGKDQNPKGIFSGDGGGRIVVSHTQRQIDAYNFTQSDLDLIGINNVGAAVCFSMASLIGGLWLDINKDAMFAGRLLPQAEAMQTIINYVGAPIGAICLLAGIYFYRRRGSVIDRVKRESQNVPIDE